jgi:predicted RNA-binding protein YlqC (UPF0109 family)
MKAIEIVEAIVKELVDKPEYVKVHELVRRDVVLLEVEVDDSDIGKVIGRKGRIIDSIRLLLQTVGQKNKKKYILEVANS